MNRTRDYYRKQRLRTIHRKTAMLQCYGGDTNVASWTHGKLGKLSKGKIHCSCPMCRRKSYDHLSCRDAKALEAALVDLAR